MTDQELDILVVEKTGIRGIWRNRSFGWHGDKAPPLSTDNAAAYMMEGMLFEMGFHVAYTGALLRQVLAPAHESDAFYMRMPGLFRMVHASPRDRCLAALAMMGIDTNLVQGADKTETNGENT